MNGIINVYKPEGISSFQVVREIKHLTKLKKIGHTGTLDPLATGVLPICIGRATKLVDYVMLGSKVYNATLKFGVTTDSYDKEGNVLSDKEVDITLEDFQNVLSEFEGNIEQIPPMYSAIKVNGKRLYELARKGIEIERDSRNITIYYIKLIEFNPPYASIEVKCSKGTYIRSLCNDIGIKLGCGATMWSLERAASGSFTKENSIPLSELTEENISNYLIPMEKALDDYKKVSFDTKYEKLLLNGVVIKNSNLIKDLSLEENYRVYINDNHFIGIGKLNSDGFKVTKLLV